MIDYKNPAELRELMERVTEGPWVAKNYCPELNKTDSGSVETQDGKHLLSWWGSRFADAHFAAISREALPYWIERATQAERAVERLADLLANEELCPQECENTAIGPDTAEDERVQICRECWLTRAMGGNSDVD